jgi:hypothetical protein
MTGSLPKAIVAFFGGFFVVYVNNKEGMEGVCHPTKPMTFKKFSPFHHNFALKQWT